jgi:hypothetical protein
MPLPVASEENANDWQDGSPLYSQSARVETPLSSVTVRVIRHM